MPVPINRFKQNLQSGKPQYGFWSCLASEMVTEVLTTTGIDWICIDGEHSPNGLTEIRRQLSSIEGTETDAMVRVPIGEDWMLKQVLDLGAQTILVPMVETAEQAKQIVAAVNYPPKGIRGAGSLGARASQFGSIPDYLTTADDQICLIVQVESMTAVNNIDEILAVDGIDGVFIGPSDLSADMGYLGKAGAPEVQTVINDTLEKIIASDKAAGILTFDLALAEKQAKMGVNFIAVSMDVPLMTASAKSIVSKVSKF